jgi:hypothetical protein
VCVFFLNKIVCKFLKNEPRFTYKKNPITHAMYITARNVLRAVKALLARVILSESFRMRPCLPFQVTLRFAKTRPWPGFANEEYLVQPILGPCLPSYPAYPGTAARRRGEL